MTQDKLLEVIGAAFSYPGCKKYVFQNVNLKLHRGEIFAILGANGAGKSTLLNCISGFQRLNRGQICLQGETIERIPPRRLARMIAYVPQSQTRAYDFSVREYVAMGRAPHMRLGQSPSEKDYALVDATLERMQLAHLRDKAYTKISGGECQQIMIARALVQQADVILLDEPTNHLDYGNQLRMLRMLRELARQGYGIMFTTHMPDHALMLGATVGMLNREGQFEVGSAEKMLSEAALLDMYAERISRCYVESAGREACVPCRL